MVETPSYITDTALKRYKGIYYTPSLAAEYMATWALRSDATRILEPCFGNGVFLRAIKNVSKDRNFTRVKVSGIELMDAPYQMAIDNNLINSNHAILGDFLGVTPFMVDAVIGNPPYVRLRSLPEDQSDRALRITAEVLGRPMDTAGSVWMAFLVHSSRFLESSGRVAFVLPYELTYVRYARQLWTYLGNNFGVLKIVRVKERLFPDIMQEAIILFADRFGGTTNNVEFEAYEQTKCLIEDSPIIEKRIHLDDIVNGKRPFLSALLPDELTQLLDSRVMTLTSTVNQFCTFNIGYVSGHKGFFHPDRETIEDYNLHKSSLKSAITKSKELGNIGIRTSSMKSNALRVLFYPNDVLRQEEQAYIRRGEDEEVNEGYKCRNRTPWYKVPDVRVPDFILSVFKETPTLVLNDSRLVASNSLLCGFLHPGCDPNQFIAAWYTSLTLLFCELKVHSLGGGVLVMIPGEVASINIPTPGSLITSHISEIDSNLKSNTRNPYDTGDDPVLIKSLNMSSYEVDLIKEGIQQLAYWRKSFRDATIE